MYSNLVKVETSFEGVKEMDSTALASWILQDSSCNDTVDTSDAMPGLAPGFLA